MVLLGALDLVTPDPGLLIWTLLIFGILWFILAKYAFKPIQKALRDREDSIELALSKAEEAEKKVEDLYAENQSAKKQAAEERSRIIKEANEMKDQIINEAKDRSKVEAGKILADAKTEIDNQKNAAMQEVKSQVGALALEIAEKVIKKNLKDDSSQTAYVADLVNDVKLN